MMQMLRCSMKRLSWSVGVASVLNGGQSYPGEFQGLCFVRRQPQRFSGEFARALVLVG